jgi:hypothetical protein
LGVPGEQLVPDGPPVVPGGSRVARLPNPLVKGEHTTLPVEEIETVARAHSFH